MKPTRICVWLVMALLLMPVTGCGGNDDGNDETPAQKPVDGTFVGKLSGTSGFVAIVASPAVGKQERRDVTVYVSDGTRLSEALSGSITDNSFTATSEDRDAEAKGKLTAEAVTGTLKLPGGRDVTYEASQATGAAGLYDLEVTPGGKLSGASAAGIGLTGTIPRRARGTGSFKLADGTRTKFEVSSNSDPDASAVRAGQVRLIVLPDGEFRGAGKRRAAGGSRDVGFFIRSSSS